MAQVSKYPLRKNVYDQIETLFIDTIAKLTDKHLVRDFLYDFLSPTEKIVLTKRLAIYVLLGKGYDYKGIKTILHVSAPTIASASTSYKYLGKGCQKVINQLIHDEKVSLLFYTLAEAVTGEFAKSHKGSGMWRYLHNEVKQARRKKVL